MASDGKKKISEILLDRENTETITLGLEGGKSISFMQCAVIPYEVDGVDTLFTLLKPLEPIPGVEDDQAILFRVEQTDDDEWLVVETDQEIAEKVYAIYCDLM